jgi:glycosyltransferase involved in cell wall biosynthesis
VLQSFPEPRPTTNPYLVMLAQALRDLPDVEVATFSWRQALTGRYDVLHVHWPEVLLSGTSRLKTAARHVLFAALLVRLAVLGRPLVRTVHNLRPQEARTGATAALLQLAEAMTTLHIRLNEQTPPVAGIPGLVVPHGHYRDWFAGCPRAASRPGHMVFSGLIRPYKNVEGLLAAFAETADDATPLTLHVAGAPQSAELAGRVQEAAARDTRVTLSLSYLTDDDLATALTEADLVVLPYREMHNSGAALLALSLDRRVLLPDNEVNTALAEEVGPGWVTRYQGDLTGAVLRGAAQAAPPARARPDLSAREWPGSAQAHLQAYREALRQPRRRPRGPRRYSR